MITIHNFNDIIKLDINSSTYDYQLVGIILSKSDEEMDEIPINEFLLCLNKIKKEIQVRRIFENDIWNNIKVGNKSDFNIISFGEYIDLEKYIEENEFNLFLQKIYNTEIDFGEAPLPILFYKIDEFIKFKELINNSFQSLFTIITEDDNEEQEERFISPKRMSINSKEQQKSNNQKKWGWYSIAFSLAKNDITKIDEVFSQPLFKVLNILSMVRELEIDLNPSSYPTY